MHDHLNALTDAITAFIPHVVARHPQAAAILAAHRAGDVGFRLVWDEGLKHLTVGAVYANGKREVMFSAQLDEGLSFSAN